MEIFLSSASQAAFSGKSLLDAGVPSLRNDLIVLRNPVANASVAGISGLVPNRLTTIINRGPFDVTLVADDTAAPVASRFSAEKEIPAGTKTSLFHTGSSVMPVSFGGLEIIATDPDVILFLKNAKIEDPVIQTALDGLVIGLKADGLWTKCHAIYPMVGGTEKAHKFNLKDPRDADSAFRLSFFGGWIHSPSGAKPDGATGYANTHLNGASQPDAFMHMSFYSRTNVLGAFDMGSFTTASNAGPQLAVFTAMLGGQTAFADMLTQRAAVAVADGLGFFISSRRAPEQLVLYKNGVSVVSNATVEPVAIAGVVSPYFIAARSADGVAQGPSNHECAFASIGLGVTAAEAANFNRRVQEFQADLGRVLLIDAIGVSAAMAFGLRKLRAAYTGACIRVRRTSDNAEQDIGFIGEELDWAAVTAFRGATPFASITTLYDQSGNGRNLTQAAVRQPPLDETERGIFFEPANFHALSGTLDASGTNKISFLECFRIASNRDYNALFGTSSGANAIYCLGTSSGNLLISDTNAGLDSRDTTGPIPLGGFHTLSVTNDRTLAGGDVCQSWLDGVANTNATPIDSVTGNYSNGPFDISSAAAGSTLHGWVKELLVFPVKLTATQRILAEANTRMYHGLAPV